MRQKACNYGLFSYPILYVWETHASNKDNIITEAKKLDKRSIAHKIRENAVKPMTDYMVDMISHIFDLGIKVNYILMDTWFSSPKAILNIMNKVKTNIKITSLKIYKLKMKH